MARNVSTLLADDRLETELREALEALEGQDEALEDAFYTNLEFGTAYARVIYPWTNRMNIYTVRRFTEGRTSFY